MSQETPELPSNSYASKANEAPKESKAVLSDEPLNPKAKDAKPGLAKRFAKQFFQMGAKEMWSHLKEDIVTPSLKTIASDMIVGAKDLILFGSDVKKEANGGYTDYTAKSQPKGPTEKERENFDFRNVIVDSFEKAKGVIISMQEWGKKYEDIPVSKFYTEAGIDDTYTDRSWGWKYDSISDRPEKYIRQTGRGFTFVLPQVIKLRP